MGEEIKESARKEAELLRAEAELQAEKIVRSARDDVVRYAEQVRELRLQKARVLGELRTVVDAHRRLLDTHEMLDREDETRRAAEADEVRTASRLRLAEPPASRSAGPAEAEPHDPPSVAASVKPALPIGRLSTPGRAPQRPPTSGGAGRSGLTEAGLFSDEEPAPIARPDARSVEREETAGGRRSAPPPGRRPPPPGRGTV